MNLKEFFEQNPEVAISFSGGVDSAYLLYEAIRYAKRVKAYYVKTAFQPGFELDDARKLEDELGFGLEIIEADILSDGEVTANDDQRCYYCKRKMFGMILEAASEDGFAVLLDGTNASDREERRPGMRALKELGVKSPLRMCGLTKEDIRERSREAGLFTWDKPSYSCLATRIPTGEKIDAIKLKQVEAGNE